MDPVRLIPAAEAAARLGVKRQTLYAYVSRGLLTRQVAMDGRSSLFDPAELEALRLGKRDRSDGELRTSIATEITHVRDETLTVRNRDLVDLVSSGATFTQVVDLLWQAPESEAWPGVDPTLASDLSGLAGLRTLVAAASASDPLRHDLSPASVRSAGRRMITAMVHGLPAQGGGRSSESPAAPAGALWHRLTARRGTAAQRRTLDVALGLLVDHGLASSTFAARVAASVRADPYSVVSAGMGVVGGPLHGAASALVHDLFAEAERLDDATRAVADALRTQGRVPGFGHSVYTVQDPRYGALMAQVIDSWADTPRLQHVYAVRDVVAERRDEFPNIDLALGALTWLAGMAADAGEVIFTVARTAGWVAHGLEEYDEAPLRFRPRARYRRPAT